MKNFVTLVHFFLESRNRFQFTRTNVDSKNILQKNVQKLAV